jgi:hypothetical protein
VIDSRHRTGFLPLAPVLNETKTLNLFPTVQFEDMRGVIRADVISRGPTPVRLQDDKFAFLACDNSRFLSTDNF